MNLPDDLKNPIIDFVNEADRIPNLKYIVLFGSVHEGEVSKKSDIDLLMLFNADHNPELGKEMDVALEISSTISEKYDLPHPFSFIMKNLNDAEDVDPDFLWNISKEGTIIWGKVDVELLRTPSKSLTPKCLITYSTKGLTSKQKGAIQRGLFGYKFTQEIKNKSYKSHKEGLIDKKEHKLGYGVLLVPADMEEDIIKILRDNKANYTNMKVWV